MWRASGASADDRSGLRQSSWRVLGFQERSQTAAVGFKSISLAALKVCFCHSQAVPHASLPSAWLMGLTAITPSSRALLWCALLAQGGARTASAQ